MLINSSTGCGVDQDQTIFVSPHVLFNLFYGHSINSPVPYFSFELSQIKFENYKYGIDEALDFRKKIHFFEIKMKTLIYTTK
jgi:hypothetical protein